MKKIILASASPRRKELLQILGLEFEVAPSNHDENLQDELEPHELAKALSLVKAKIVAGKFSSALVISADTFVVFRGRRLGKPHDDAEAREMLHTLNGESHRVITGFTVIDTESGKTISRSVETRVYMKKLTVGEIEAYVRSREPLDKAGAYALQGLGSVIVERIEGDYANVIGLPLSALAETLKEFGVSVL